VDGTDQAGPFGTDKQASGRIGGESNGFVIDPRTPPLCPYPSVLISRKMKLGNTRGG
jgi:hypothetical protein